MAITLFGDGFHISPFVFSVLVTLEEKQLPYKVELVKLHEGQHKQPPFRDQAALGRIPEIDHDGFRLGESLAIVEYLEDVFPARRVLPEDVRERARARMVLMWLRSDLNPLRQDRPTDTMFYKRPIAPLTPEGQAAATRLVEQALRLIPEGRTTLARTWSLADSDLAFMLQRLGLNGHELPARLRAYVDAQWSRPSVQKFVRLERVPYVGY
jgi:glutathione S-transferase